MRIPRAKKSELYVLSVPNPDHRSKDTISKCLDLVIQASVMPYLRNPS